MKNEKTNERYPNEIKKNIQGTNSDRKETMTQINDLEQKEEINIQPEQNEETRIQKKWREVEKSLEQPEMFQYLNYGVPEGEEQKEIENLFEQIMKENFPNLPKEIDF